MQSSYFKDEGIGTNFSEPVIYQESLDNFFNDEINFFLKSAGVSRRASRKELIQSLEMDEKLNPNTNLMLNKSNVNQNPSSKSKFYPNEWSNGGNIPNFQNFHYKPQITIGGLKKLSKTTKESEGLKLKCSFANCGKKFRYTSQLKTHERSHNGEKPYKCDDCKKCFSNKGNLVVHRRIHTGEKPFKCEIAGCVKEFKTQGQLKDHLMQHYDIRPFQCTVCGVAYRHKSTLQCHMTIHTGEKPFDCIFPSCDRRFNEKGNMKTHLQTHYKVKGSHFLEPSSESSESQTERTSKNNTRTFNLLQSEITGFTIPPTDLEPKKIPLELSKSQHSEISIIPHIQPIKPTPHKPAQLTSEEYYLSKTYELTNSSSVETFCNNKLNFLDHHN